MVIAISLTVLVALASVAGVVYLIAADQSPERQAYLTAYNHGCKASAIGSRHS